MTTEKKKINGLLKKAIREDDIVAVKHLVSTRVTGDKSEPTNQEDFPSSCLVMAVKNNSREVLKYFLEETNLKKYSQEEYIEKIPHQKLLPTSKIFILMQGEMAT